jgi:hypothetical protein
MCAPAMAYWPRKNHKRNAIDPKLARHFDIIGNLPVKGWIRQGWPDQW